MRRTALVVICGAVLLSIGVAVIDSGARIHRHQLGVTYSVARTFMGPSGVAGDVAFCPDGYAITGGGYQTATNVFAYPIEMDIDRRTDSYSIIWVAEDVSGTGNIQVEAACIKTRTARAQGASVGARVKHKRAFRRKLERVRALHAK